ncbi:Carboxylesterase family [Popillia japonica]|uniref:Carboxylic ester hydrolase n=1 Tax=Popillia japonica TaxID=7064 RepID=A0AAW1IBL2_POPJA
MLRSLIAFIWLITILISVTKAQEPLLEISQGVLQGSVFQNRDGGTLYGFRRIPYAQPPIDDLRFKAPVPADGWEGIRDAANDMPSCTQFSVGYPDIISGQEDCLYLNVFIPALPSQNSTKKPVMVYIHGGGFFSGDGTNLLTGPEFLLTKDIILVSIHYRLGVFGFINFEDSDLGVPGNAGLKDQVLALKWVKENIADFGGDPDNVLIFGTSAGSISVHLHMVSPMSTGLFSKVIGQSGVALFPTLISAKNTGVIFAEHLGIQTANLTETLRTLREISAVDLSRTEAVTIQTANLTETLRTLREISAVDLSRTEASIEPENYFFATPNIELDSDQEAFLTRRPIDILLDGDYNHVSLLTGINDLEGLLMEVSALEQTGQSMLIEDFTEFIPEDLEIAAGSEQERALAQKIKNFYYGDNEPTRDNIMPAVDLYTDFLFAFPAYRAVLKHAESVNDVFFYYFTADTDLNIKNMVRPQFREFVGAAHTDELGYMFKTAVTPVIEEGSVEDLAIRSVVNFWTNFATYGNPTPDDSLGYKWEPVKENNFNYLHIGTGFNELNLNPRSENIAFWSQIYDEFFPRK